LFGKPGGVTDMNFLEKLSNWSLETGVNALLFVQMGLID
jgi:hypothetical protein